jgi:hypothetical protein
MSRPRHEVAEIIERFCEQFIELHHPNTYQLRVLNDLSLCRTSALGGHKYRCDHCKGEHISYNSCRNRHCPKCQSSQQAFWVEERVNNAYPVKHYHLVFTIPEILNAICMIDSGWFYNHLFACVWDCLQVFGYSHFGVESGAICLLHTWGQNLTLHPHIHCIVPAVGYNLRRQVKHIGKQGKYLYPVRQLSTKFRGKFLAGISKQLADRGMLSQYKAFIEKAWKASWVVFCEPSLGSPKKVFNYLGQYTHRVAISNQRIVEINDRKVRFKLKDYRDAGKIKTISLDGVEFLRRLCLHFLPKGFVKIRHYGIYSSRFMSTILRSKQKMVIKPVEAITERIKRITGIDVYICPLCKKGRLVPVSIVPRIRSPVSVYSISRKHIVHCA